MTPAMRITVFDLFGTVQNTAPFQIGNDIRIGVFDKNTFEVSYRIFKFTCRIDRT